MDDRTRLGRLDLHLIGEGRHRALGRTLGAQPITDVPTPGVRFAVWAPNARSVAVVGRFGDGDSRRAMQRCGEGGVWELFAPGVEAGFGYQYEILPAQDREPLPLKADPVALQCEPAPRTGSIVASAAPYPWTDDAWLAGRAQRQALAAPLSIYELHAASWRRHTDGRALNWRELAVRLLPYVADLGFTHIELLPVMAHPFGGSWGYQPLGLYAPQPEWGTPEDFATFVDRCHARSIGVILDWVPAHFPSDAHGLAHFDGTALYEHADPREGFHPDWNTLIYNLGRHEVRGFVLASALHWLERYHVDGLRVDAVASMLYRDYSRRPGEWIPNHDGGRENYETVAFLRELSTVVAEEHPGALLIAEESTAWPGVTHPAREGGLGFDYKWNMGWMHDSLQYLAQDPIHRRWHHARIGFGLVYAFSEQFILPLSHDEVVHGKGSLLRRMPGDRWQKFANLRAYFGFMWAHPGKKLLFMGGEFAQDREWNHDVQLDWHLLDDALHRGVQSVVRDLNRLLRSDPALHGRDGTDSGFEWIVEDDQQNSVFAFCRHGPPGSAPLLAISNFTPVPRHHYRIGVPRAGRWCELFNSDAAVYGGSNLGNQGSAHSQDVPAHGHAQSLDLTLPPLATLLLRAPAESG